MKKEELQMIAFQMIANAGEAKTNFVMAIDAAENGDFEKADELMKAGATTLAECGKSHLPVVSAEASNESLEFSVIFMHAEDQYLTTQLFETVAQKFINVYKNK